MALDEFSVLAKSGGFRGKFVEGREDLSSLLWNNMRDFERGSDRWDAGHHECICFIWRCTKASFELILWFDVCRVVCCVYELGVNELLFQVLWRWNGEV